MSESGEPDLLVRARSALLDALDALVDHHQSVVVIGAQAIYLHTGEAAVALAEMTKDSDLALDPRSLGDRPLLENAMLAAGFEQADQPGTWINAAGIPVDLMVPAALAGTGGRRGARVPPHSNRAMRRASGLEAAVVDHGPMRIEALAPEDTRVHIARVAGPAALLVSKVFKVAEREEQRDRLRDKDAHDIYRLLAAVSRDDLSASLSRLREDALAGDVTRAAPVSLERLFAAGADALGSRMAGRAEEGVGDPEAVSASVAILARELLEAL
jgi:hypothetical protein